MALAENKSITDISKYSEDQSLYLNGNVLASNPTECGNIDKLFFLFYGEYGELYLERMDKFLFVSVAFHVKMGIITEYLFRYNGIT